MSIWGKIIGGTAGFALGGPLGALLGGLAGHALDRMHHEPRDNQATKQVAFTIGVIVLGAKMAKADGVVTKDEVHAFREVFQVPMSEAKDVARVFDLAKRDSQGFEPYAHQLANMFSSNPAVLEDLLDGLFHIAKADSVYHPAENDFLGQVADIFGFSRSEFDRIKAAHVGADEADPYAILGVSPTVTDKALKASYRRLIREHHPDALMSQGLPQEFIDVANDKLATINDAYDRIARERGLV